MHSTAPDPTTLPMALNWQRREWDIELAEYAARIGWGEVELEAVLYGALVVDARTQAHLTRHLALLRLEREAAA